jgi:hypothetical protein
MFKMGTFQAALIDRVDKWSNFAREELSLRSLEIYLDGKFPAEGNLSLFAKKSDVCAEDEEEMDWDEEAEEEEDEEDYDEEDEDYDEEDDDDYDEDDDEDEDDEEDDWDEPDVDEDDDEED